MYYLFNPHHNLRLYNIKYFNFSKIGDKNTNCVLRHLDIIDIHKLSLYQNQTLAASDTCQSR